MFRFALLILPFWLALAAGCRSPVARGEPGELLAQGKAEMERKEYREAIRYFRGVAQGHEESEEAEEGQFLLAEARRLHGSGARAFESYKVFADRYPNSRFAVGAAEGEYQLGQDFLEGRIGGFLFFKPDRSLGLRVLEHMQVHYRTHTLASDALVSVAGFEIDRGNHEEAIVILRRLLSEYPRNRRVQWARFHLAQSLWELHQGPDYDTQLLTDSRLAFNDFIGRARQEGLADVHAGEIELARQMIARIDARLALNEYRVGRLYERTGHPDSAVFYYEHCRRAYPETEGARQATARIGRLRPDLNVPVDPVAAPAAGETP